MPASLAWTLAASAVAPLATAQQQDLPADLEPCLEQVGRSLEALAIAWERTRVPIGDVQQLVTDWRLSSRMLAARRTRSWLDGRRFRVEQDLPDCRDQEWFEVTYDGANLHVAGTGGRTVYTPQLIEREWRGASELFQADYFECIGIRVASTVGALGMAPTSVVLEALHCGAVHRSAGAEDEGPGVVIAWTRGESEVAYRLDPSLAFAVRGWTERRGGRLVRRVAATDFVRMGCIHLPRLVESRWWSWPGSTTPSAEARLVERFRVTRLVTEVLAGDLRPTQVRPGEVVFDGRHAADESAAGGFFGYQQPVPVERVVAAFDAGCVRAGPCAAFAAGRLLSWGAVHVLGLTVWAGLLTWVRRGQGGAR